MTETPLEKLIGTLCDTSDLTAAEVREELAAEGVDVDAAKARFMPKLDDLMRARAVRLALAALKANPPDTESPLPWRIDEDDGELLRSSDPDALRVAEVLRPLDARCIAAAVNAAPVLAAEVEAIYAKIPATYNGNLDAIFAHARGYQDLGITMAYAQHAEDSDDLSYEEQLALLIKQRDDAVAEVERLTALLAAARVAVEKILPLHARDCASHGYVTLTPITKWECDCAARFVVEARRAVGLEESHG